MVYYSSDREQDSKLVYHMGLCLSGHKPDAGCTSSDAWVSAIRRAVNAAHTDVIANNRRQRGLINGGNQCFANSVFQALMACPPFYRAMRIVAAALRVGMPCVSPPAPASPPSVLPLIEGGVICAEFLMRAGQTKCSTDDGSPGVNTDEFDAQVMLGGVLQSRLPLWSSFAAFTEAFESPVLGEKSSPPRPRPLP